MNVQQSPARCQKGFATQQAIEASIQQAKLLLTNGWLLAVVLAVAYFLAAVVSSNLSPNADFELSFWLPGGLTIGFLLLTPRQRWAWIVAGLVVAELAFNYIGTPPSFFNWALVTAANTASVLLGAWLIQTRVIKKGSLDSVEKLLGIVFFGGAIPFLISATIGTWIARNTGDRHSFGRIWEVWYVSDILGVLLMTPMALLFRIRPDDFTMLRSWKRATEALAVSAVLGILFCCFQPVSSGKMGSFYPFYTAVLWTAVRFGRRPILLLNLVIALGAGTILMNSKASFRPGNPTEAVSTLEFQAELCLLAFFGLVPSIVIAAQREVQSALKYSEERWKFALEGAGDGVWDWDITRNTVMRNKRWKEMLGFEEHEILDSRSEFTTRLHPEDSIRAFSIVNAHLDGKTPVYQDEVRLRHKDGSWRWILIRGMVVERDAQGAPLRMIGTHTDISIRKQYEQELLETNRRLREATEKSNALLEEVRQANTAKSDFLASMSHEIRTPLNGILGFAELLLSNQLPPEQREFVHRIQRSGENLMAIINDILDLSKIEAGKLTLEIVTCDLVASCVEIVELMSRQAWSKGVEVILLSDFSPVFVWADRARLRQILVNLVGNAIKFTDSGQVIIELPGQSAAGGKAGQATVRITDTGIGIVRDQIPFLFQKFRQVDSSNNGRFGGTGLGLAICKSLTEMMEGEIGCESEFKKGSTFWMSLRRSPHESSTTSNPVSKPIVEPGFRVLWVKQPEPRRRAVEKMLLPYGINIHGVGSVDDALAELKTSAEIGRPYQAIFVDATQPEFSRYAAVGMMTNLPEGRRPRIIPLGGPLLIHSATAVEEVGPFQVEALVQLPIVRPYDLLISLGLVSPTGASDLSSRNQKPSIPMSPNFVMGSAVTDKPTARVLLVEDNPINQMLASQILKKFGCSVDVAVNGLEAVEMTAKMRYDVVFMDWQMPEMDGLVATSTIRIRESTLASTSPASIRRLPIVILTANAMAGDREKCLEAGADDYLSKPFQSADLRRLVEFHRFK